MGNQTYNVDYAQSRVDQCETAIIQSCNNLAIPRAIINIILQYSEHWKWQQYEASWSETAKKKSKYLRVYDIHLRQLRLELRDSKRRIKSSSALKSTHFNRFEYGIDPNTRKICFTLNFFRYAAVCSATNCPVLEGFIRVGLVSNMYRTFGGRELYKKYSKNGMLSNGMCFVGLSSRVIFDENIYGLHIYDVNNANGKLLKDDSPIKYDEPFEICIEPSSARIVFKRLLVRDEEGKPKQYELCLPAMKRFKKEKWYPMVAINPYKSRFLETGCQISKGMML